MDSTTTRIAIVGGGIGGLICAIALHKLVPPSRLKIDIYESTSSLEAQVGAALGIWPRGWQIMEQLGLDQDLLKCANNRPVSGPVETFTYRVSDRENGFEFHTLETTSGTFVVFHRARFQSVLLSHIPPSVTIHTSKRLSQIREYPEGRKELIFTDQGTATADIVVGADGLQSVTRRCLLEQLGVPNDPLGCRHPADAIWSGTMIYRALIPRQKLIDAGLADHPSLQRSQQYQGRDGFILTYPIAGGSLVNFGALVVRHDLEGKIFDPHTDSPTPSKSESDNVEPWSENSGGPHHRRWVARVDHDEVKKAFQGWESFVVDLVKLVDSPLRWAIHVAPKLDVFAYNQMVLIGDAAHAMLPHQGVGAGQAIEDAYTLASLLSTAISSTPPDSKLPIDKMKKVMQVYNVTRVPTCQKAASRSRANGYHFTFRTRVAETSDDWRIVDEENPEELEQLCAVIKDEWKWTWERDVFLQELDAAIKQLETIL